ncbi:TPA: 3-isopropylmalate dehydratase large subunit [bacterium]|nr:3-isopropylmalate dehydratase large subunit [bacterium]
MNTIIQILSAHIGREVTPGEFVETKVEIILGNDITFPLAIEEFEKSRAKKIFNPDQVVIVLDHFTPNKDIESAQQCRRIRQFAKEHNIKNLFEGGFGGIEHALLPEEGLVVPGDIVIGADSHTCTYGALGALGTGVGSTDIAYAMITGQCWLRVPETIRFIYYGNLQPWVGGKDLILYTIGDIGVDGANYRAMEFSGETISRLPMDERFTICNMAIEAGGKCGYIEPDEITLEYINQRTKRSHKVYKSNPETSYIDTREYNVSKIEPQVALPHLPSNTVGVSTLQPIEIDQAVIGSCTNGWLKDLRVAASILKGRKVHKEVRLIVIPATQRIYREALKEGLIEVFIEAGAVVSPPTCGPCLGGHMGVLAEGERAIATTNRNFIGRMGHPKSEVYLANPAVTAASAILGRIASPQEVAV